MNKNEKINLLLIDGNNLFCRCYHALKFLTNGGAFGFVKALFTKRISLYDIIVVIWDGGRSERRLEIYPEYKGQRKRMTEEEYEDFLLQISMCEDFCDSLLIPSFRIPKVEADDIISVLAKCYSKSDKIGSIVIVSTDDDFNQLLKYKKVSLLIPSGQDEYNYKNSGDLEFPAEYYSLFKSIIGDSSDNIKGIYGIGKVKAQNLIHDLRSKMSWDTKLVEIFKKNKDIVKRNLSIIDFDKIPEDEVNKIKREWSKFHKNFVTNKRKKISPKDFLNKCNLYNFHSLSVESMNQRYFQEFRV